MEQSQRDQKGLLNGPLGKKFPQILKTNKQTKTQPPRARPAEFSDDQDVELVWNTLSPCCLEYGQPEEDVCRQRQAARENSRAVKIVLPEPWPRPSIPSGFFDYMHSIVWAPSVFL